MENDLKNKNKEWDGKGCGPDCPYGDGCLRGKINVLPDSILNKDYTISVGDTIILYNPRLFERD